MQMVYSKGLTAELLPAYFSKETDQKQPSKRLHLQDRPTAEQNLYAAVFQAKPHTSALPPLSIEIIPAASGQGFWQVNVAGEKIYSIRWDGGKQISIEKK